MWKIEVRLKVEIGVALEWTSFFGLSWKPNLHQNVALKKFLRKKGRSAPEKKHPVDFCNQLA